MTARSFGSQTAVDGALDGQRVRRRVDVLARAREMRELGDRVEPERRQAVADEILDGFHVVPRDGFLLGQPVDLGLPEVAVQRPQVVHLGVRQRGGAEQRTVGEGDEPLDLDLDAGPVETGLGEIVGEGADGGEVPPVQGTQRLRRERGHGTKSYRGRVRHPPEPFTDRSPTGGSVCHRRDIA